MVHGTILPASAGEEEVYFASMTREARTPRATVVGEVIAARWHVIERLGAGAMGTVYRAERVGLGKSVAIKVLDEHAAGSKTSRARFDREARAISRLDHLHCVSI